MDKFKEFQGKDLDECIKQSCEYFDCPREKLEIELVQDAKSGIFGIVGARKAKIRARRAQLRDTVQNLLGSLQKEEPTKNAEKEKSRQKAAPEKAAQPRNEHRHNGGKPKPGKQGRKGQQPAEVEEKEIIAMPCVASEDEPPTVKLEEARFDADLEDFGENEDDFQIRPLEELDAEKLEAMVKEVVGMLVRPIAGRDVHVHVDLGHERVRAKIDWTGDAGLLIGREGQTLAAIQYLATRMISKGMKAALRVQLDIGDYRRRQDDKLRELAKFLADKARHAGRSFSTRPLSSYHRRIIHLCLQDEPDVQTRSSGEGPLKRVIIFPRREKA